MKKLLVTALLGSAAAACLHAQVPANNLIATGDLALLAGWDFNSAQETNSLNARYSDAFYATGSNLAGNVNVGRLFLNGSNGSDLWSLSRLTGSGIDTQQPILSRSITGSSVTFVSGFGAQGGTPGAFEFDANGTIDTVAFSFNSQSTVNNFEGISVRFRASIPNFSNAAQNVTLAWSYKIGSAAPVSTGITTVLNSNPYASYVADFSGVVGMNGQDDIFLLATVTEADDGAPASFDNFGIYGIAAPIPEPSTFAALAGIVALGMAAARRRRQAA